MSTNRVIVAPLSTQC